MKYKFSDFLEINYDQLKPFLKREEEVSKNDIVERCSGEVDYELLQQLKELQFDKIGKSDKDELYII